MRNELPKCVLKRECGIINLDTGRGTHWTGYVKLNNRAIYFDSFGNLRPPIELVRYLQSKGHCEILYNYEREQDYSESNCGHLTLKFLYNVSKEAFK